MGEDKMKGEQNVTENKLKKKLEKQAEKLKMLEEENNKMKL